MLVRMTHIQREGALMKISIILVLTFLNSCFVEKDQSSAIGERNKDHKLLLAADTDIPIDLVGRFERSCQKMLNYLLRSKD